MDAADASQRRSHDAIFMPGAEASEAENGVSARSMHKKCKKRELRLRNGRFPLDFSILQFLRQARARCTLTNWRFASSTPPERQQPISYWGAPHQKPSAINVEIRWAN
jgi:hypothetical protein